MCTLLHYFWSAQKLKTLILFNWSRLLTSIMQISENQPRRCLWFMCHIQNFFTTVDRFCNNNPNASLKRTRSIKKRMSSILHNEIFKDRCENPTHNITISQLIFNSLKESYFKDWFKKISNRKVILQILLIFFSETPFFSIWKWCFLCIFKNGYIKPIFIRIT